MQFTMRVLLYAICFVLSMVGLSCIDFGKIIHKGKAIQAQLLLFLLSMAMAYLVANFIMSITYTSIFY